ncbi:maleylpyruvate isomerase family mycothiol-dependent enzyme [Streptomyces sp. NPDC054796]
MDESVAHISGFGREVRAFEAAVRPVAAAGEAPLVPSCPGWTVTDLIAHLGAVHRYVLRLLRERVQEEPDPTDLGFLGLPAEREGWPVSFEQTPTLGPVPGPLVDWFAEGALALEAEFRKSDPRDPVWTWAPEHTAGFWMRIQAIEAAVHRWDAENVAGEAGPFDPALAADAVAHTFQVMAPARRAWAQAPRGAGERFRFRRTDGPEVWTAHFDGDDVRLLGESAPWDVELAGTASDLMLFLWERLPADRLDGVRGDRALLERYFALVPPR